jgi:hypothetical protein
MRHGIQLHMKRMLVAVLIATTAIIAVEAGPQGEVERAREILERSAKAYKNVAALRDTLSYVVNAPGSEQETKTEEYGFGIAFQSSRTTAHRRISAGHWRR